MLVTVHNCAIHLGLVSCCVLQLHHDSTPLFCLCFILEGDNIGNSWASYQSWVYWWIECMLKAKIKLFLSLEDGIFQAAYDWAYCWFLALLFSSVIEKYVYTFAAALSISCRTSEFAVGSQTVNIDIEFLSPYQ